MPWQDIDSLHTDELSPLARQVLQLDLPDAYSSLVVRGDGNPRARSLLQNATGRLMLSVPPASAPDAEALLGAMWLWHDWLDEAHRIAQANSSPTGSFWHAIMHRREGDFDNSRYWYARCADHPILAALHHNAAPLIDSMPADTRLLRLTSGGWNPAAFVDLVQAVHDHAGEPLHALAVSLQQLEWRLLFEHCARQAAGR